MNFTQKIGAKLLGIKGWDLINADALNAEFKNYFKLTIGDEDYIGDVFTAIDTWGLYFAKAKFRLYEMTSEGKREVEDHDFLNLFEKPNSYQTWWQMAYTIPTHFGLFGNSYIYKIRTGKKVTAYQQLFPSSIKREFTSKGIVYKIVQTDTTISPNDIIDFKYPNPYSDVNGFPIINSITDRVTVNKLQMAYLKKFYEEGGFLGLTFSTDKELNATSFKRTKELLESNYSGVDNASKVGLFDSGLRPVPTAYSVKDADVGNQNNLNRDAIFSAFKVSKILVGLGETQNRATAEAAQYQFTSGVIDPILNYIDQVLTQTVKNEYGKQYLVVHDTLAAKDQQGKLDYYSKGLKEGWLNINEVRKEEGWNPIDGELADTPTINVGGALVSVSSGKQLAVENTVENTDDAAKSFNKSLDSDIMDLRWKQFDRRTQVIQRKFANKLDDYFESQRRRMLEALKDNFIVEEAFNLQDENMLLYQLLEIDVWDIMREGYKYGDSLYDISQSLDKSKIKYEIDKVINSTLNVNATTLESLRNLTDSSLVNDEYNKLKTERLDKIATTVTIGSFNAGLLQAMRDAGLSKKTWLSQRDTRVRDRIGGESHVKMDGVMVDIDMPFEVPSRKGVDLMQYPADPAGSLENIINDRCTILGE